jgi:hypothetical protein
MTTFDLKKYERFQITGNGTVFTVHRDENVVDGIAIGDRVHTHSRESKPIMKY